MYRNWMNGLVVTVMLAPSLMSAQQTCANGIHVDGIVTDPTGAVIPGAQVQAANGERTTTDATGHYVLPCISTRSTTITVRREGFSTGTTQARGQSGDVAHVNVQLVVAAVQTDVQVGDDPTAMDAGQGTGTRTLGTREVQQLADDPDDFLRQLQALASIGGGIPGSAIITVDGFQNTSALPPKGSIATIRINPDMFSPEYERAPYLGGRVEIFTKPSADSFHGALFLTDSDGSFNATDPFSLTATPAGKRRYGFELSGPVVPKKSGFALTLEKRDIDEFNVVNAVTLDANDNQTPLQQTVSAPQRLWIASARNDWQLTPKDVATLSFAANVNNLGNQGVGGLTLTDAGYSSLVSEYDLRFNNITTLNANLLHETRIGYTWKRTEQTPLSNAPSVQVAGYFTGGGATSQNLNDRERDLEIDDDLMVTHGKHDMKLGAQSLGIFVHDYDPNTFNGAYVFGGGSAPVLDANNNPTGQTTTILPIEQYRRALLNLPGGNPTTYQITTGTPVVPLTQWRLALYAQDTVKLTPRLTFTTGLRYQLQTTPGSFANFSPRVGLAWSPDKKGRWVIHARAGIFHDPNLPAYATEVYRLNGVRQHQTTVYSPGYTDPLTPVPGSIQVGTINAFPNSLSQMSSLQTHLSIEHNFRGGWHALSTLYWAEEWGGLRTRNINAPLVNSSNGTPPDPTAALLAPRPIAPNENILQYQNSGHLAGNIFVIGADHNGGKRFDISAYYVHTNLKTNTGTNVISPQSSYSDKGESSRPDGQVLNAIYASGSLHLPWKVEFSSILDAESGQPYNVTTGTDANGDGDFNDRPSYASVSGAGVYSTRFGLLSTNTVNGDVPRNLGTMPARIHLDSNLSRAFLLDPKDKDHPRTLTFNARSANLINHTNVAAVGTIVSSSTFGQSLSAETARRVELGARFTF
jgi:Carboxypeptidase regulatory-like domain/TonB dependent receptor